MNRSKSGNTHLTAVVVMAIMAYGAWGFADANGSDRHSEPEHQRIIAVALAWIEALERGDLPVAASQCIVEPAQRHDLFVTLAVTSADMRLRDATLRRYGSAAGETDWLDQGHTAQELRELLARSEVVIVAQAATLKAKGKDWLGLRRFGNGWRISLKDEELTSDLNRLKFVAAKNMTTKDILAGNISTRQKALERFNSHFVLMDSALGALSPSQPGCLPPAPRP